MRIRLASPGLALLALLPGMASCGVQTVDAIRDLSAIHDPNDWSPRSPAQLSVPPEVYLTDRPVRTGGPGVFEVEDHRELEASILSFLGGTQRDSPALVLETSSWLAVELLHDDYPEARVQAAAILSSFAGYWIEEQGVRLDHLAEGNSHDGDFSGALTDFMSADDERDSDGRAQALARLAHLPLPGDAATIRALAGVGRRLGRMPLRADNEPQAFRFALRCVLSFLRAGSQDRDPTVAEACRVRLGLLESHAIRP